MARMRTVVHPAKKKASALNATLKEKKKKVFKKYLKIFKLLIATAEKLQVPSKN